VNKKRQSKQNRKKKSTGNEHENRRSGVSPVKKTKAEGNQQTNNEMFFLLK